MTETILQRPEPYYEERSWFFGQWRKRHKRNKNMILCATGQSLGIGKSYWLLDSFEAIDPDFTIEQVVFTPQQFWYAVDLLPSTEWHPIMWDDPTRGLQKRDWYLDVNKTVTSFMKTASRYKRKDLGFAVPTFDDLDIAVREIMVVEAQMKEAGLAKIHRIKRNRFGTPPFWKPYLGEVKRYVPKLASEYEKKREEFHRTAYEEKQFAQEEEQELKGWKRIYELVKETPEKFRVQDLRNPQDPGRLSARKISALLDCSDNTARKVVTKIEFEQASPSEPSV